MMMRFLPICCCAFSFEFGVLPVFKSDRIQDANQGTNKIRALGVGQKLLCESTTLKLKLTRSVIIIIITIT